MPHPAVIPNSALKAQIEELEAKQSRGIGGHGTAARVRSRLGILYAERRKRVAAGRFNGGHDV